MGGGDAEALEGGWGGWEEEAGGGVWKCEEEGCEGHGPDGECHVIRLHCDVMLLVDGRY